MYLVEPAELFHGYVYPLGECVADCDKLVFVAIEHQLADRPVQEELGLNNSYICSAC